MSPSKEKSRTKWLHWNIPPNNKEVMSIFLNLREKKNRKGKNSSNSPYEISIILVANQWIAQQQKKAVAQ